MSVSQILLLSHCRQCLSVCQFCLIVDNAKLALPQPCHIAGNARLYVSPVSQQTNASLYVSHVSQQTNASLYVSPVSQQMMPAWTSALFHNRQCQPVRQPCLTADNASLYVRQRHSANESLLIILDRAELLIDSRAHKAGQWMSSWALEQTLLVSARGCMGLHAFPSRI